MIEKYLTENTYIDKIKKLNDVYWNKSYKQRWAYINAIVEILKSLNLNNILEIGSMQICLSPQSDNLDLSFEMIDKKNLVNKIYIQDCLQVPYNITDKYYDMVVMLQVLEHLSPKQLEVFKEVKRISKNAIISIPHLWNCPDDIEHHMITKEHFDKWTDNEKYKEEFIIKERLIRIYNF